MEENGKLLRFVYHKGELVYERGEKEQTGTSYHQGAGTEAINRAGKIYYYHKDEQLSTALITDETGTVSNCYRYDAFGNILDSAEQIENRIRYTGQQYDGITGQYYLRARYYNPSVGRFMQEDTYRGDGLNLYAYCANNPVTYYDPSGYAGTSPYVAADGGDGGAGDVKTVKPESAVTGSKKHGVNWKEGPARAKSTGNPQGQWAQSDLEYATEMANTLKPRESGYFSLPEGAQSIVYMPDGTVQPATQMWIRNNGTGTWHGYPMQ